MKNRNNNRGEVMVEAAIYFPFVLMIVFFILILSIVQLNQYIINYQAARVTDICSTSESYYAVNASAAPSFAAGLVQSDMPSEADIIDYYKKKQSSYKKIKSSMRKYKEEFKHIR